MHFFDTQAMIFKLTSAAEENVTLSVLARVCIHDMFDNFGDTNKLLPHCPTWSNERLGCEHRLISFNPAHVFVSAAFCCWQSESLLAFEHLANVFPQWITKIDITQINTLFLAFKRILTSPEFCSHLFFLIGQSCHV